MQKSEKFQWQPLVELGLVLVTILGSTIPLYLHTDNKLENSLREIRNEVQSINSRTDKLYEVFIELLKETKCDKNI